MAVSLIRSDGRLPARVVHLSGGLRALDLRAGTAVIQIAQDQRFAEFQTTYAELYDQLRALALKPIGVEFLGRDSQAGKIAPDWQCADPSRGFKIRQERIWWDGARHVATDEQLRDVVDLSARISTYLALLPIRVLQLSDAYNRTLRAYWLDNAGEKNRFFDNSFRPYIDSAIHAFVADAASFRDVLAEAIWKLVLKEASSITKFSKFLRKAKPNAHPLAESIITAGEKGGWLRSLSDLRNHITHVAPVGHAPAYQFCQPRMSRVGQLEAPTLHYPILDANGGIREFAEPINPGNDMESRAAWESYEAFCNTSLDALDYCWGALGRLIHLLSAIRSASGLKSKTPMLTKDDLVGPPRVRTGEITQVADADL
jgi:hypothetical protein